MARVSLFSSMASESRLFSLSPVVAKQIRDFRLKGHKLGTAFLSCLSLPSSTHETFFFHKHKQTLTDCFQS